MKKEVSKDGSIDQNVFDIMQGVSINLFVKTELKKDSESAKIFHNDFKLVLNFFKIILRRSFNN